MQDEELALQVREPVLDVRLVSKEALQGSEVASGLIEPLVLRVDEGADHAMAEQSALPDGPDGVVGCFDVDPSALSFSTLASAPANCLPVCRARYPPSSERC